MKQKKLIYLLCFLLLLSGCSRKKQTNPTQVVSHADIIFTQGEESHTLSYNHPKKLEAILNYLRTLRYQGKDDPEQNGSNLIDIKLYMTNGTCRTYRQQDYAYLCRNGGPWKKIDPMQGRSLMILLKLMPPD